ncbi:MAG: PucR family transcriptional regulator ligand-binding domain-containing protein [Actinomycetota bacterium]|nr:PucR family transcriptional regulator ligand-binding domain-containing protein [Actinomycetota bacterium]
MSLAVSELLQLPGLRLSVVAGARGLESEITWAHISELSDPTPWLSGGELLLTTGMSLGQEEEAQRLYVERLVGAGVSGLGFGVGFGFEAVPDAMVAAAEEAGLCLLEVPLPVPFIAITKAISSELSEERLRDAQLSVEMHERLASLVSEGAGPADVLDEVCELRGGWAILFDPSGGVVARSGSGLPSPDEVWAALPHGLAEGQELDASAEASPGGSRLAVRVVSGRRQEAVLVYGAARRLQTRDRIVVHHAVTVLGLLLASRRAVIEAERRIAGDLLSEAFAGRLRGPDLERRLELAGFPGVAALTALAVEPLESSDPQGLQDLSWALDGILGRRCRAARTTVTHGRVACLVAHDAPETLAGELLEELDLASQRTHFRLHPVRAGVGETVPVSGVRRSYLTAVFALRAAPGQRRLGTPSDLGSYRFLLSAQPTPLLEGYVRTVLGELEKRDQVRSSQLVESVRAFIAAGGRWERGAESLGVHRHTLRYRVRQAEQLLNRDLSSAEDRLEVWLALRAAEILEE